MVAKKQMKRYVAGDVVELTENDKRLIEIFQEDCDAKMNLIDRLSMTLSRHQREFWESFEKQHPDAIGHSLSMRRIGGKLVVVVTGSRDA